jgi:transposase
VGVGVIQITPQMRILVAIEAVDGRKGIDSLARLCEEKLAADPFSGSLFVFRSRRGTSIRGGRAGKNQPDDWKHTRRSSCWPPATRKPMPRRCGAK